MTVTSIAMSGRIVRYRMGPSGADLLGGLREAMWSAGRLESRVRDGKQEAGAKFSDYFDFAEPFALRRVGDAVSGRPKGGHGFPAVRRKETYG